MDENVSFEDRQVTMLNSAAAPDSSTLWLPWAEGEKKIATFVQKLLCTPIFR